MDDEDAKKAQLVAAVVDIDVVKAAGVIDGEGNLRRVHGHASVLRHGESVDTADDGDADGDYEDVYLESIGDEYLVVAFGVDEEFEPIKREIDAICEKLAL